MILNHKAAIEMLVEEADLVGFFLTCTPSCRKTCFWMTMHPVVYAAGRWIF